jgi:HPr kinase/phosphorylase
MSEAGVAPSVHASAVAVGDLGILIRGGSGAGKSRLAFDLILAGAAGQIPPVRLIGDDRVVLTGENGGLIAQPAPALVGLLEIRGLGVRRCSHIARAKVGLVVDLGAADGARLPEAGSLRTTVGDVVLPRIPVGIDHDPLPLVLGWLLTGPFE